MDDNRVTTLLLLIEKAEEILAKVKVNDDELPFLGGSSFACP